MITVSDISRLKQSGSKLSALRQPGHAGCSQLCSAEEITGVACVLYNSCICASLRSRASMINSKAYSYNCMLCALVRTVPSDLCFICKRPHISLCGHHFSPFKKLEVRGFRHIKLTYNCSDMTKKACGVQLVVVRSLLAIRW